MRWPLVCALVVALALPALSHTLYAEDYNHGLCFGTYWSDPYNNVVEAGMNDSPNSTGLGDCTKAKVTVSVRDDQFVTYVDQDTLMPMFVEVDEGFLVQTNWSKHESTDSSGSYSTFVSHYHG
jgi:hypothetical protein